METIHIVFHILPIFYSRDCVFIGHEDANLDRLPFFVKDFRVGYNAMINDYGKIEDIKEWIRTNNVKNHLFLFSASTFTNLAVVELFREFPDNTYIDIGTCLTPMMDMPTHRGYLQSFWNYQTNKIYKKYAYGISRMYKQYWEFVRVLRNDERVQSGFIKSSYY
jgi:hypothetical protein